MLRFFLASLFLHVLVFGILFHRSPTVIVIEDPIVAVSLDLNEPIKLSKPVAAAPTQRTATTASAVPAEAIPEPSQSESAAASSSPLESGNVSVKPRVLRTVQIPYPQEAKQARIEGVVRLKVIIDEQGLVQKVNIIESPGFGLGEAAQAALQKFIFSPAEVQGQKVSVQIVYVYRFRLESR